MLPVARRVGELAYDHHPIFGFLFRMTLHAQAVTSFKAVATGTLRLDPEAAAAFAGHVADANEGIFIIGQLCTGPNALASETMSIMLERWFRAIPGYLYPRLVLEGKPGAAQAVPEQSAVTDLLLHGRVLELCISQRGLSEAQGLRVADLLRRAVPAFFMMQQKCMAPDRQTQRVLCATLRAVVGQPLQDALAAADIYLGNSQA
jgi:hypothetical protein